MKPKISVITATRNVGDQITGLYESLRRQTYSNFEWVVMDGVSTDSTLDHLREMTRESPWVRFSSEADFGLYHAINKAIGAAEGEFYVVAGGDDRFDADALAQYAKCLEQDQYDVVLAQVLRAGRRMGGFYPSRGWISPSKVFPSSHSVGMLFRKDLHARYGLYSRRFPLLADSYFLKLLLQSGSVRFLDADFVAGEFAEGGLSTVNKIQILSETWQIQMLTERSPLFQTLLLMAKIVGRYPSIKKELRARDTR